MCGPKRPWPRLRRIGHLRLTLALALALPPPLAPAVITVGGTCNLHAAIAAANDNAPRGGCPAGSGADTIRLTEDVTLIAVDNNTDGPNGLPSVTSEIMIEGNGHFLLRDTTKPSFRIFHVAESGDLTLEGVLLGGGRTGSADGGGGILSRGSLAVVNSTVGLNFTESISGGGGGILIWDPVIPPRGISLRIERSLFHNNFAHSSGAGAYGGAVLTGVPTVITDSTFLDNQVSGDSEEAGGGAIHATATVSISNSTFSGNEVRVESFCDEAFGGAVAVNARRHLEITNSTFSGNTARAAPICSTSVLVRGGAISAVGPASIDHVTFYGNTVEGPGDIDGAAVFAHGADSDPVSIVGSLFAASTGDHCSGNVIDQGGGNLADDATCLATMAGEVTGLDSNLQDNGGPTMTHALLTESSAIDTFSCDLPVDQRGGARSGDCDSGAFEDLGCPLLEIQDETIDTERIETACSTAILGPQLSVESPGILDVTAGVLVTLQDGVSIGADAELVIDLTLD